MLKWQRKCEKTLYRGNHLSSQPPNLCCSVGITAYNEQDNIGPLLEAMIDQHLHQVTISEIIIVASGCTDNTVPIIKSYQKKDPRIRLIEQPERRGKTSAINLFLEAASQDILVLESGDTLPQEYAVENLVRVFEDPTVGMTGAHKIPVNTPDHLVGLFTHLRLRMEHELCMDIPRLGEMIAFRRVLDHIPPDVAMDEAFVEAIVVKNGLRVIYSPDAVVYNTGPDTISDFVRQRRRNHAGHLFLQDKYGHQVSSLQNKRVARIAFREVWGAVQLVYSIGLLGILEGFSRFLGWYDFAIKRERHVVWDMAYSQKQNVQELRKDADGNGNGNGEERPIVLTTTQQQQQTNG
ncbi:MAG: glycosyltransferase [Chloroflexota bacterium]|nr:glycosyltransferase [Chloroflexota bacterium]